MPPTATKPPFELGQNDGEGYGIPEKPNPKMEKNANYELNEKIWKLTLEFEQKAYH